MVAGVRSAQGTGTLSAWLRAMALRLRQTGALVTGQATAATARAPGSLLPATAPARQRHREQPAAATGRPARWLAHATPDSPDTASPCHQTPIAAAPFGGSPHPDQGKPVAPESTQRHPAAAVALAAPCPWPHDIRAVIEGGTFDPPPWNVVFGPVCKRGAPSGLVMHGTREIARWGDIQRGDMAFSVAKSYLGVLAAAALDRGLIADLAEPVSARIDDPAFASPRNRQVTWRQLLDQTSEWGGELFGIPHTVDRDRQLAPTESGDRMDRGTPLQEPGTYWDYNDIRVNALCLALTRLFERPLAEAMATIHPAFAPETGFRWHGYGERSTIGINGAAVEVAVGGGHWGGGVVASAAHHLALGRLVLHGGNDGARRCIDAAALRAVLQPCPLQPVYGGLWWLNREGALYRAASPESVFALGVGTTVIWVEPAMDVVAVSRWIRPEAIGPWVEAIRNSLGAP